MKMMHFCARELIKPITVDVFDSIVLYKLLNQKRNIPKVVKKQNLKCNTNMADNEETMLRIDEIKKEPREDRVCEDGEDEAGDVEEVNLVMNDQTETVESDTDSAHDTAAKSDDDMQGYDTRSEVASSVTSDSDSGDDASSKSFDVKRKRQSRISSQVNASSRKTDSVSPLKKNSAEYLSQLNYLFRDARFFIIKSSNSENIALSKSKGVWATLPQNQIKLSEAFRSSENVILIFSAKESGKFSGFARLATGVDRSIPPIPWVVPAELTLNLLKGTFKIDWICRKDLPFSFTTSLYNPWNNNKPVKIARDGQEVEPRIGEKLCRLFPEDENVDITAIARKSKDASKNRSQRPEAESPVRGLYTAKYRAKMLHYKNPRTRIPFLHRVQDGGPVSKHYRNKGASKTYLDPKKAPLRNRVMNSLETYVKRFGPPFRPPLPLPFMPPPPPLGSDIFPPQFAPMSFPTHLPRFYDPPPVFSHHFSKIPHLHPSKSLYDRSVEEFLRETRDKEFHSKKEVRSRPKESGNKGKRSHYRDRR